MKKKKLIDLINNDDSLYSIFDVEDILPEVVQCVAKDLEIDKHRWFTIGVVVYACEDGYVGVRGVCDLHSEMMCYSDCNYHCKALEYEEVVTITYKPKKG